MKGGGRGEEEHAKERGGGTREGEGRRNTQGRGEEEHVRERGGGTRKGEGRRNMRGR